MEFEQRKQSAERMKKKRVKKWDKNDIAFCWEKRVEGSEKKKSPKKMFCNE